MSANQGVKLGHIGLEHQHIQVKQHPDFRARLHDQPELIQSQVVLGHAAAVIGAAAQEQGREDARRKPSDSRQHLSSDRVRGYSCEQIFGGDETVTSRIRTLGQPTDSVLRPNDAAGPRQIYPDNKTDFQTKHPTLWTDIINLFVARMQHIVGIVDVNSAVHLPDGG